MNGRLLVFNCHEAWVYQLRLLDRPLDVILGLPGRPTAGWDESMRPVPPQARFVQLEDVRHTGETYDCIIAHNLTDLLDAKNLSGPRLLVLHCTLEGMILEQKAAISAAEIRRSTRQYLELTGAHAVSVSRLKGRSWGFEKDPVTFAASPEDYPPHLGDLAAGLRISNYIQRRPRILLWEFHERAFAGLPVTLVGHNDGWRGITASPDWNGLKEALRRHRFYIHTADPHLEDGYNMATVEAMAAGLPVLGNRHPSSPIEHGVSGFLSDDPAELGAFARHLLDDRELAQRMGRAARETAFRHFSNGLFRGGMSRAIEAALNKWRRAHVRA
jgi:hypothetical protein